MCTIMTIDRNFWIQNKQATISRILSDARLNSDGWAVVGVDPDSIDADFNLQSMRIAPVLDVMERFFLECSVYGRVFLHSRFATTRHVGIAYTHGFTDSQGTIIMHNGIVDNYRALAVDSFNLTDYPMHNAETLLGMLTDDQEAFANLILIRPAEGTYGIVRLLTGQLHTDAQGNYSSYPFAGVDMPVPTSFAIDHSIGRNVPKPSNIPNYLYDSEYDSIEDDAAWKKWVEEKEFKKSS